MANKKSTDKKGIIYAGVVGVIIVALIAIVLIFSETDKKAETTFSSSNTENTPVQEQTTYTPAPLDSSLTYYADIDMKDYGKITVKLDQAAAPITCANFVELANSGFYNGLTLHRIMEGFMMQGGDPLGTGMGGSDNNIVGEFTSNGEAVFVQNNASVEILGGSYKSIDTPTYTLNQLDKYRATTSIVVKGGKFYNFNPADNAAEGENTNFVAAGYSVEQDGDWYIVK